MNLFAEKDLFIFEMANNHQGDTDHAKNIIRALGDICREEGVRGAVKFQFRNLDSIVHPDFRDRPDVKHIPRFVSTALSKENYKELVEEVRNNDLLSMCTPFDEPSVDQIFDLDIEIVKIGSCSALDKPLLEKVSNTSRPVIVSTGGLNINEIDWVVNYFESKRVNFALMHCVSLYPTPNDKLNLNQIQFFKSRFPNLPIGFSTHESPDNLTAVQMAQAKGATLFEKHVGIENDKYKLNAYSANPEQVRAWIRSYKEAVAASGGEERPPSPKEETDALKTLYRGIWAKQPIIKGEPLTKENVFFSMPLQEGQISVNDWENSLVADRDYEANFPISDSIASHESTSEDMVYQIMLQVKGLLNLARIYVNSDSTIEISHHYGLERFREFGAVIINCINREYAKKLIVQLPRQKHPYHFHGKKEETFQLLYGDMEVELDGHKTKLEKGDTFLVERGQWHKFHTLDGAIFEEISTTHFNNDSFYEDKKIATLPREERKTCVSSWNKFLNWRY
jgi:sialic acid synthase SpsE/mannose-6-phosphate isomerase-like protein (cupin superfamily)